MRPSAALRSAAVPLATVLLATGLTLLLGLVLRGPCAGGSWEDGRQYRRLCYTDIVPLYATEQLQGGRLPYLEPCEGAGGQCDEYPVLTMYLMRVAAWLTSGYGRFFYVNVAFLSAAALLTAGLLHRMVGGRAMYFAAAPTLAAYSFVNWDLLAVALATAGTYAVLRARDAESGALLGLGAAAKLYPGLLSVPFALERVREGRTGRGVLLLVWTVVAFVAANIGFAMAAPHEWSTFFRFNAERPVDWDSLWFVACQRIEGGVGCSWPPGLVNTLSLVAFAVLSAVLWKARRSRDRDFPRWTFAFPFLVAFLLTNKVYSPQYSLWLLPWFALALPNLRLFALFQAADVAVFVTRFTWFGRLAADGGQTGFDGFRGVPLGAFEAAVVVRAAILVACLWAWARRTEDETIEREASPPTLEPAPT